MAESLPVVNLSEAKFECIYGRGCDGLCCRNGRPGVSQEEMERIDAAIDRFLPEMRPEARALVAEEGYLSQRRKQGLPMLRVVDGWCVFFNQGCVLHKVGAAEGDKYHYKPVACSLFPLDRDDHDRWFVRQKNYDGEIWDLFCLDPTSTPKPAAHTLEEEIDLARRYFEDDVVSVD